LNVCHAEQERLRKQRRAEQEANVARKRAGLSGTDKTDKTSSAISVDEPAVGETSSETSSEGDRQGDDEEWDNGAAVESPPSEGSGTIDERSQLLEE
jgi:ribosome biogenesis protein SSF1/2